MKRFLLRDSAFSVYHFLLYFPFLIRHGTYRGWKSQGDTHQSWQCLQQRMPVPMESQPLNSLTLGRITPTEESRQLENLSQEQTSLIQTVMVELPTQRQAALIISVFQTSRLPHVTQERMKINSPCLTLGLWTTPTQNNYLVSSSIISSSFQVIYIYKKQWLHTNQSRTVPFNVTLITDFSLGEQVQ